MKSKMQNFYRRLANWLTLIRAFIALPLIISLSSENLFSAWIFIILAGISDLLDGLFARKAGGGTVWGAKLDPLVDKIIISLPIIWLTQKAIIPFWATWLIISRELLVTEWRSQENKGGPASFQGKLKTTLQFSSILLMIWPQSLGGPEISALINRVGYMIFWPSLILSFTSLYQYIINLLNSSLKKNLY